MVRGFPILVLILAGGLSIAACDGSNDSRAAGGNFVAGISGAVAGRVSGPGIIRFLPPRDAGFGLRPGYFFVADDSGVRELGITFTIPADTQPGTYELMSAHPMDSGKAFEVRVDRSIGKRTESFEQETEGTITIEAFPDAGDSVGGSRVAGSFRFTTQNAKGQQVTGEGAFDFHAG